MIIYVHCNVLLLPFAIILFINYFQLQHSVLITYGNSFFGPGRSARQGETVHGARRDVKIFDLIYHSYGVHNHATCDPGMQL